MDPGSHCHPLHRNETGVFCIRSGFQEERERDVSDPIAKENEVVDEESSWRADVFLEGIWSMFFHFSFVSRGSRG